MTQPLPAACAALPLFSLLVTPALAVDWKELARRGTGEVVTLLELGGGDEYDEGDPLFVRPSGICVDADQSFYVIDADGFVVHFSRDGGELNRFGRQGEGPGELMDPFLAVIGAGGALIVYESGNRRFSWLAPDGTFLESKPFQDQVEGLAIARDGGIVMLATGDSWLPEPRSTSRLARFDGALSHPVFLDSLSVRKFQPVASSAQSSTIVSTPYYEQMAFCVLADGSIAYGRGGRYEIHIVGPDLKPRATLRRDIKPELLTNDDREEYFSSFEHNGPEFVNRLRSQVEFPKHKPMNYRLFADGRYLVVVREGPVLDVFEGETFLGEVAVPEFRTPRAVGGDRYFRPKYSDDALPAVVVYSVR